jgi:hypothetical protein
MTHVAILLAMLVALTTVGWPRASSSSNAGRQPGGGSARGEA